MNQYPNLSHAIEKVFEARVDAFMSQLEPDPGIILSDKVERKLQKLVKRRDKSYYPLICTIGRRIACIAAIIIIFSLSAMSIKPVRATVIEFFTEVFPRYIHISTQNDELTITTNRLVEHSINLPAGFKLSETHSSDNSVSKFYIAEDKYIEINQINAEHFSANYDNERTTAEKCTDESGQTYTILKSDSDFTVIWKNADYVYSIKSNLTISEILDLCKQLNITNLT